jgi:hypothetical protein
MPRMRPLIKKSSKPNIAETVFTRIPFYTKAFNKQAAANIKLKLITNIQKNRGARSGDNVRSAFLWLMPASIKKAAASPIMIGAL